MNSIELINKYNNPENSVLYCESKRFLNYRKNNPIKDINSLWADYHENFPSVDFKDIEFYLDSLKPDYNAYTDFISKITEPKVIFNILPWFKYDELIVILNNSPLCDYKNEDWIIAPLVLQVLFYSVNNDTDYPEKLGEKVGKIIVEREDFFRLSSNYIVYLFNELQFINREELRSKIRTYFDDFLFGISSKINDLICFVKNELEKENVNDKRNFKRLLNLFKCFIFICKNVKAFDENTFQLLYDFILYSNDVLHTSVFTEPLPNDLHFLFANYYMKSDNPIERWEKTLNNLFKQLHRMRFSSISESSDLFNKINFVLSIGLAITELEFKQGNFSTDEFELLFKKVVFLSNIFSDKLECDFYRKYLELLITKFYFLIKKKQTFDNFGLIDFINNLGLNNDIAFYCIYILNLNGLIQIKELEEENKYYLIMLADFALKSIKPFDYNKKLLDFAKELIDEILLKPKGMSYSELKNEIEVVLRNNLGTFMLPYQIYYELERLYPFKWIKLNLIYSNKVGVGAGSYHTPVAHIADALSYFTRNKEIEGLEQADFCKNGIKVYDIQPSPSQITLGIWRIKK